jgi:hypothetical protein
VRVGGGGARLASSASNPAKGEASRSSTGATGLTRPTILWLPPLGLLVPHPGALSLIRPAAVGSAASASSSLPRPEGSSPGAAVQLLFHVGFPFPVARIPSRLFLPLQYSTVATTNRPMTRHVSAPNTQRYGGTGRNLFIAISRHLQRNVLSSGLEVLGIDGPSSHPHLRPRGKCLAFISRCYAPSILLSPANGPNSGLTRCGGVELLATSNTHPCFSELARAAFCLAPKWSRCRCDNMASSAAFDASSQKKSRMDRPRPPILCVAALYPLFFGWINPRIKTACECEWQRRVHHKQSM